MRGADCFFLTGSYLTPFLLFISCEAVGVTHVPRPRDRFEIDYRVTTEGTISATGEASLDFTQILEADITATVLEANARSRPTSIDFAYRRVSIEVRMATDTAILELFPNRLILDGTPLYDSERVSDEAPPVLAHLLNESFRMEIGEVGEVLEFKERRKHRRNDAFLDLVEPIRSLWVEVPSGESVPGQSWTRLEPLRMLGDLLLIPATATYTVQSVDSETEPVLTLARRHSAASEKGASLPARIGYAVPGSLRSDALGPDLFAPPPSARIENLVADSTETIRLRTDWGFLQSKKGTARLDWTGSLPQIDGPRRYQRRYELRRTWTVEVKRLESEGLEEDVRYLLFGEAEGALRVDSP